MPPLAIVCFCNESSMKAKSVPSTTSCPWARSGGAPPRQPKRAAEASKRRARSFFSLRLWPPCGAKRLVRRACHDATARALPRAVARELPARHTGSPRLVQRPQQPQQATQQQPASAYREQPARHGPTEGYVSSAGCASCGRLWQRGGLQHNDRVCERSSRSQPPACAYQGLRAWLERGFFCWVHASHRAHDRFGAMPCIPVHAA